VAQTVKFLMLYFMLYCASEVIGSAADNLEVIRRFFL